MRLSFHRGYTGTHDLLFKRREGKYCSWSTLSLCSRTAAVAGSAVWVSLLALAGGGRAAAVFSFRPLSWKMAFSTRSSASTGVPGSFTQWKGASTGRTSASWGVISASSCNQGGGHKTVSQQGLGFRWEIVNWAWTPIPTFWPSPAKNNVSGSISGSSFLGS